MNPESSICLEQRDKDVSKYIVSDTLKQSAFVDKFLHVSKKRFLYFFESKKTRFHYKDYMQHFKEELEDYVIIANSIYLDDKTQDLSIFARELFMNLRTMRFRLSDHRYEIWKNGEWLTKKFNCICDTTPTVRDTGPY